MLLREDGTKGVDISELIIVFGPLHAVTITPITMATEDRRKRIICVISRTLKSIVPEFWQTICSD